MIESRQDFEELCKTLYKDYVEDSAQLNNFTMIPNIVIESTELSLSAYRLYSWYKKVCDKRTSKQCGQSAKTIGKACSMSRPTIIKARKELVDLGLITMERVVDSNGNARVSVKICSMSNPEKESLE